jgi:hypothetical protein
MGESRMNKLSHCKYCERAFYPHVDGEDVCNAGDCDDRRLHDWRAENYDHLQRKYEKACMYINALLDSSHENDCTLHIDGLCGCPILELERKAYTFANSEDQ